MNLSLHLPSIFFQSCFSFAVSPLPRKCFLFLFSVRASLNFKVASHLILKWKITFIGKILKEFWGHWCLLSCQLKRSYWFLYQSVLAFIATYHNVSAIAPMTSVSFIALSHPPPIKFYFLTTMYFQIINFICSSIVWQSVSSSCRRYHSLSHSPRQQNFRQLCFSFWKVWEYPTSLISWFINFKHNFEIFHQFLAIHHRQVEFRYY